MRKILLRNGKFALVDKEDAATAYDVAAKKYFGRLAFTNFR